MFRSRFSRESQQQSSKNINVGKTSKSDSVGDVKIDNSATVLHKIAALYKESWMSDISLVVGGTQYRAHRLILCASSEVFQDLVKLCIEYMCEHIPHAAVNNQLISWLQRNTPNICQYQVCQNFVKWNLELVAETTDFGNFEPEILVSLLQQNDLVVHNEMVLYNCVVKWLNLQKERLLQDSEDTEAHMEQLVVEVMSHVRFPMMSPRQLAELLLSPLTKKYKEFFVERMAIGMSFH
ncbi:hypothetical protein L9F63_006071 [Diploptera punctata]|uniref:BTB domain-containing protein n=1 Tax=Diploptera punctata TaxID=6984 RepID=A0AAD7ZBM1_DIPPU|nr:hypothetical protein L9F63_006071 [Diploptera punctata]